MDAGNVHLETTRLVLREQVMEDAAALNAIDRDPRVTRFVTYEPRTMEETLEQLAKRAAERTVRPRVTVDLAMVLREDGRFVGRCGLTVTRAAHREAMIWYVLDPREWGRGLALEAARAVVGYAFEGMGMHRVYADCDPRNTGSCRVAEKLGLKREGLMRGTYFLKGEWCDTALYGVVEEEWGGEASRRPGG